MQDEKDEEQRFMKGFLGDRHVLLPDLAFSGILGGSSESFLHLQVPFARKKPRSSVPKCGKCGLRQQERARHLRSKSQSSLIVDQRCICLRTRIGICGRNVCLNPYKRGKGSCSKKPFASMGKGTLQEAAIGAAEKTSPGDLKCSRRDHFPDQGGEIRGTQQGSPQTFHINNQELVFNPPVLQRIRPLGH